MGNHIDEKGALIVGAGGIGMGIAKQIRMRFPHKKIWLADINEVSVADSNIEYIYVDLSKGCIDSVRNLNIDMLVVASGIGRLSEFKTYSDVEIEKVFMINTVSVIKIINAY